MIVVLMGVAGVGKTTVGRELARRLGVAFVDADEHHSPVAVAKMTAGVPLDESDRAPWLARLNALLREHEAHGGGVVLACSALGAAHRQALLADVPAARLVHLVAAPDVIRDRLRARQGHFFPPDLLESQLALLEPPREALVIESDRDLARVVDEVARALASLD